MNIDIIVAPLIGGFIGYITNFVAIKMLFHPYKAIHIGRIRMPFTPGIIPKEREKIASAIGLMVQELILNKETISKELTSEPVKVRLKEGFKNQIGKITSDGRMVGEVISKHIPVEKQEPVLKDIELKVTGMIADELKESDLGKFIVEEMIEGIQEKLKSNILGKFVNDSLLESIGRSLEGKINEYLEERGASIIQPIIGKKIEDMMNMPVYKMGDFLLDNEEKIEEAILSLYDQFIIERTGQVLENIDFVSVVRTKINEMDMAELEAALNRIIKHELNWIVYIGAILGFLIGIINIFI